MNRSLTANEIDAARHELVARSRQLLSDGLGIGSAGT